MTNAPPSPYVVIQDGDEWWQYTDPVGVIVAESTDEVIPAIQTIEQLVEAEGWYAAGYLAFEAAAAYGLATHALEPCAPPLLWFGLFARREAVGRPIAVGRYDIGNWQPSITKERYAKAIVRIKEAIDAGDVQQINFTFHLGASFSGDAWSLFADLAAAQRSKFCACVDLGSHVICSASPELFFRMEGSVIESRPMKGTASRGLTMADDRRQIDWLQRSEKNRTENVMAANQVGEDFQRIAVAGSINMSGMFAVERYPTLLQMISTVRAETVASLTDILAATFPPASIAGVPRGNAMQLINELEPLPRGVYTGAIGVIAPARKMMFNVAIRTAVIDRRRGRADYCVGSGIGKDSYPTAEYEECLLKSRILDAARRSSTSFSLLESLRWTPEEGYYLLDAHLQRLRDSAEYFSFPYDDEVIRQVLAEAVIRRKDANKVRLLLDERGRATVGIRSLAVGARPSPLYVGLARMPVSTDDVYLYHKTTRREVYENARSSRPDCDDVILWNEHGELTEASMANVVLELDGRLITPPIAAGLLPGTMRAHLLAGGEIEEGRLQVDDLLQASRIWLINSVRGWQTAVLKS